MAVFGPRTLSTNVKSNMLHPFTVTLTVTVKLTRTRSIITTTPMIVLVLLRINNCVTEFVFCIDQSPFGTF